MKNADRELFKHLMTLQQDLQRENHDLRNGHVGRRTSITLCGGKHTYMTVAEGEAWDDAFMASAERAALQDAECYQHAVIGACDLKLEERAKLLKEAAVKVDVAREAMRAFATKYCKEHGLV